MMVLSCPYAESGVVDADVFASYTEHSHSSRLLLLNGVKVSGVWYLDSMGSLCSGYGPSVMLDDVSQPFSLLLSASNTESVGVILRQAAFNWIPVLAPHRNKPSWAVSASSSTVETVLLTEAGIDPLPTVSTNLSLFLVPTIFPFTFKLPALDNLRLEDMSKLATAHGNNVAEWAQIMLNYSEHGENAITFIDLDSVVSYLTNVISALQCMFNCAHTQAKSRPLLYNCIMTLFNFVTSKKTKDWFKDHAGKMPLFPTYIALLLDKLFVGFVKSAENYINQCAAKDGIVANLDMDDLSRAIGTFYNIVKEVKKFVDYDKHWVDYPAFLLPPDATPEGSLIKRVRIAPLTNSTSPPGAGGRGAGRGSSPGCGDGNAGRGGGRGAGRGSGVNTWGTGASFGAGSFGAPQACVFATTKAVMSSLGARATPLGPSAPRFESNIALNTPPTVISAATSTVLSSTDGLTTTQPTSKLSSWPILRQTRLWS